MSEKTTEQLRDDATSAAIDAAESRREVERLRALLQEKTTELVQVTIERDEVRRELAQVQDAERAVRRLVLFAKQRGETFVSVDDVRAELET